MSQDKKGFAQNDVSKRIEATYKGESGFWIVEQGRAKEAVLFQEAAAEIDKLQLQVLQLEEMIDSDLSEERATLKDSIMRWQQMENGTAQGIRNIRIAAKSLVTQIDKATTAKDAI